MSEMLALPVFCVDHLRLFRSGGCLWGNFACNAADLHAPIPVLVFGPALELTARVRQSHGTS